VTTYLPHHTAVILLLLCYADEIKYLLIGQGVMQEGVAAHIVSSITAGLAVATTTNPLDLVKARYMNQEFDKVILDCGAQQVWLMYRKMRLVCWKM
jgi:hypothetical protein